MNEYVIHAKLKNNLVLRRILNAGHRTVAEFCKANALRQTEVGLLINLKRPALTKHGRWSSLAERLADILGVMPEELFSEEQRTVALQANEAYVELSRQQALASAASPLELLEQREVITRLLECPRLTQSERIVIQSRFGEEQTIDDVAGAMNVSRERVRQVEARALRKLRARAEAIGVDSEVLLGA